MAKKILVEGQFSLRNKSGIEVQFYEEEFVLDDSIMSVEQARQIVKRGLISDRLSKKIPGFRRALTIEVRKFEDTEENPENAELDLLLTKAVALNCVPINIDNYKRKDFKIKALEKAIETALDRLKSSRKQKSQVEDHGYVD